MLMTIIVPFRNASSTLQACLDALLAQCFPNAEFILVDNNSSDESREIALKFHNDHPLMPMKILVEPKPGTSVARNLGAREARGDWLVFTDSDCIPDTGWLRDLATVMPCESTIGAIAGSIHPAPTESVIGRFLGLYILPANAVHRILNSYTLTDGGFPTANLAVRSSVFLSIGGFDETIPYYGEDHDLCRRIYRAGYGIMAITNAVVRHIHRDRISQLVRQSYGFGTSHSLLMRRMDSGMFIIRTPVWNITKIGVPCKIWCDFNQADKKMLVALLAGLIYTPLILLPFIYLVYLSVAISQRARKNSTNVTIFAAAAMACLLIVKSSSLTCGRITGSFHNRVICI